jgi:hypothetical protein
MGLLLVWSK